MDVFKVRGSSESRQQTCLEWFQDGNPAADDACMHRGHDKGAISKHARQHSGHVEPV